MFKNREMKFIGKKNIINKFIFALITVCIFRLIGSLPVYTQRLLVLLFGTFRVIASNSERAGTGMSSEALGVSVAPSFFQTCVSDGKIAKMEDVMRFKVRIKNQIHLHFFSISLFFRIFYVLHCKLIFFFNYHT